MFITSRALITVRKDPAFDNKPVVELWDSSEDLAANGVSFLLYGLLDHLVDGHFEAVESLDEAVALRGLGDLRAPTHRRCRLHCRRLGATARGKTGGRAGRRQPAGCHGRSSSALGQPRTGRHLPPIG